jgi:Sec7-like guanine-nucleotide exchange factor
MMTAAEAIKSLDELIPDADDMVPAEGDRERAKKVYDGNEDFIQREKAAAWMGEEGPARSKTLIAYMELYDFSNLNILAALRMMCGRLVLKAESQQVDRILVAFSRRWCQCNPNHGFKGVGKFVIPPS